MILAAVFVAALTGTLSPAAAVQQWTLTKTPNPSTYTTVGQVITYTYVVTSLDDRTGELLSLVDNKVSTISCPTTVMPSLGSITCTGSYTITATDIANGSVTNTATVNGDSCTDGCTVTAQASATITAVVTEGSITIIKTANGGDNSFTFASTIPGAASFTIVTANGTANRVFSSLTPGSYSVSEVDLPRDWKLSALTCTGNTGGGSIAIDVANRSAVINLVPGEAISCTFANVFDVDQHRNNTQQVIQKFLSHRNALLATHEPDRSRFVRRVPGSLWGGGEQAQNGAANELVTITSSDGDNTSRLSFATSLSQMAQARANPAVGADGTSAMALGGPGKMPRTAQPSTKGLDVWIEGHFSEFRDRAGGARNKGRFGILYLGADYLVMPAILVGALVQIDWAGEAAALRNSSVDGRGYMAGPYVSVKLTRHLFFDARAAWGSSDNSVNPFGDYADEFSTDRRLAHAKLTGNWRFGDFRLTPSLGYTFVEEKQRSYTDSLNVPIPSQTVSLGRLSFGPEIAYRYRHAGGTIWEPHVSVRGVWDDTNSRSGQVGGFAVGSDDFRAMAQAGVLVRSPGGLSLRAAGSYDGLGSSTGFRSVGGQVWLNIPLR